MNPICNFCGRNIYDIHPMAVSQYGEDVCEDCFNKSFHIDPTNDREEFPGMDAPVTELWDWYYIEFLIEGKDNDTAYHLAGDAVEKYLNGWQ